MNQFGAALLIVPLLFLWSQRIPAHFIPLIHDQVSSVCVEQACTGPQRVAKRFEAFKAVPALCLDEESAALRHVAHDLPLAALVLPVLNGRGLSDIEEFNMLGDMLAYEAREPVREPDDAEPIDEGLEPDDGDPIDEVDSLRVATSALLCACDAKVDGFAFAIAGAELGKEVGITSCRGTARAGRLECGVGWAYSGM
eukprot:CAMPEP_0173090836 /NCGR_PEP_ID=MMETSP1102-20130122/27324_1 /TAXON_ID=49646 /ORGANISM="Geminigera sp., Strain Caron Lab Isolate" /LENGTH=196 /DNA_ID=CAMNT_0013976121 /DNA_START=1 /DNA_END=589 /DNA_ORIENTATION=+